MNCTRCGGLLLEDPDSSFPGVMKCSGCGRQAMNVKAGKEEEKKKMAEPESDLETQSEFAERHGVHYSTVHLLVKNGTLTATKEGLLNPATADQEFTNRKLRGANQHGKQNGDAPKREYKRRQPDVATMPVKNSTNGHSAEAELNRAVEALDNLISAHGKRLEFLKETRETLVNG